MAYGLVHPLASWDAIYTQLCWWKYMCTVAPERPGIYNKVMTFFNGPGWEPGKPRLGYNEDIPIVRFQLIMKMVYVNSTACIQGNGPIHLDRPVYQDICLHNTVYALIQILISSPIQYFKKTFRSMQFGTVSSL